MNEFVFQWPWMLSLLILLLPIGWLLSRAREKSGKARQALGHEVDRERPLQEGAWLAVVGLLILALARPGYDPVRHTLSQSGRDVVFVLDISRSMLAQDVYPSRLEAAKQGIRDCLDRFSGQQVGLVIYAGSSSIACPLTSDYEFTRYMLSQVQPRSVEFGGTLLLSAMEKVVDQVLDEEREGFHDIVILTDGEDHGPDMERVAKLVEESGASLLIVGLGDSTAGSRIPIVNDDGETISLKHEGSVVYTKLQDATLGTLARMSPNSEYYKAGTSPFYLADIYKTFAEGKEEIGTGSDKGYVVYREASFFIMPLALGLALYASGILANLGLLRWREGVAQ